MKLNVVYNEECLAGMAARIPDASVDMILCDLPYGTTACKWDTVIPFEPLWEQYERITKPNGAIVLTASQPFTSALLMSRAALYRHEWTWIKNRVTGHLNAKRQPLRTKEDVLVFGKGTVLYNPQGVEACEKQTGTGVSKGRNYSSDVHGAIKQTATGTYTQTQTGYPKNVLHFDSVLNTVHPTQKPVKLFEYLIKTYTNEGDIVLDNCMGSGTTAIACINTGRKYVGFEWHPLPPHDKYFAPMQERIMKHADPEIYELLY